MKSKLHLWFFGWILLQLTVFPTRSTSNITDPHWSVHMAESIKSNSEYQNVFDYVNATAMNGFRSLWQETGNEYYFQYIKDAVDNDLSLYETITDSELHDIDWVNGGSLILFMYLQTGEAKYRSAADSLLKFLKSFPRTSDSGFCHKDIPRMQVDDLYMGCPFLAEYGKVFNKPEEYDNAILQAALMEKHTRDSVTGLYYHVWYEIYGPDSVPVNSPYFWGRGMGWAGMALVDMLEFLPTDYSGRDTILGIFQRFAETISKVQDDTTGVWWQILDQGGHAGNWLESSASCMFVYALAKGVRLGYIDESYWHVAKKGYQGILDNFIRENADGTISITHVCPGQSPGFTYEIYVRDPGDNEHAVGPFIMASIEIEKKGIPPSNLRAVTISDKQIDLYWQDNSDNEDGFRIERKSEGSFSEIAVTNPNTVSYNDSALTPLTEYTYRIRMFKGIDTTYYSKVVSSITLDENGAPAYATQPDPSDGSSNVYIAPVISWLPGAATTSHNVYFGTTNPPPFIQNQTDSIFFPDLLGYNTTYYWRIDEVNNSGTTTGNIWSFTTGEAPVMVAHWKMDENSGTVLYDATNNGNHGILINMNDDAWISGIYGNALQFDGIDDYIIVPVNSSIDFGYGPFSISFWLKQPDMDRYMTYFFKVAPSLWLHYEGYEVFFSDEDQQITFGLHLGKALHKVSAANTDLIEDEWNHVVAVRDTSTKKLYLYINSNLCGSIDGTGGDLSGSEVLYIGVSPEKDSSYFKGMLDDIRFYRSALNNIEIQIIYNDVITNIENHKFQGSNEINLINYPNPFRDVTAIIYSLTHKEKVRLSIYDLYGQEIKVLTNQIMPEGKHKVEFNADKLHSGTYIIRLQTNSGIATRKVLYMK